MADFANYNNTNIETSLEATSSSAGLMSTEDKAKLDSINTAWTLITSKDIVGEMVNGYYVIGSVINTKIPTNILNKAKLFVITFNTNQSTSDRTVADFLLFPNTGFDYIKRDVITVTSPNKNNNYKCDIEFEDGTLYLSGDGNVQYSMKISLYYL